MNTHETLVIGLATHKTNIYFSYKEKNLVERVNIDRFVVLLS